MYSLYASPAGMVSYTHVIEADDSTFNNGGIVHEFVNSFDAPPAIKFGNPISNQRYSNFGFNNGAPLRRTYFNLVGGVFTKLKEEAMTYRILIDALAKQYKTYQVDTVVLINKIGYVPCTSSNMNSEELDTYDINIVYLFSHFMYQDTMVVTEYTPSGNMVSRFLNFYDNRQHLQKTGELTYNSSGELIEKLVKYAYDFSGPGNVYEEMQNQNLVADPVEEKVKKQGTLLVTDSKTYIKNSTTPLRFNIQKLTQKLEPAAVEDRLLFTKYDLNGNILEVQKPLDVMQTYLYGYNAAYPVAKVVGANHTTVAGFINQSVLDHPFTTDEQMRTELNKIRTGLANTTAQVITYPYKPLVGVTSETDANGRTTYYEYDELHRLLLIRDQDKRIIKKMCYNYTGQSEGCAIYYNAQQSGAFTRSCTPPYTGSQVTYTVAAGTYLSTTSQSQADAYAVNDVNANGQAYANANGTCTYVCGPGNCAGQGKKCVNNVCETGIKIYTDSQFNPNTGFYECTYHYEWSDGLWSQNFVEQSAGDCVIW